MATNSLPDAKPLGQQAARPAGQMTATDIVELVLTPLSSLRLTVTLLFLSVLVVFLITLQQSTRDMWEIKAEHYASLLVEVPFQSVVVERWFPNAPLIPGSFFIPSGFLLIVMLLVNLTAAHCLRFRLQATGKRLMSGLVVATLGSLFTWAIIFNNQSATTFQADPPITYRQMWWLLQAALALLVVAGAIATVLVGAGKTMERLLAASFTLVMGIVLATVLFLGESAFIGNEGMRIVWQLAQSTAAALVLLVASVLLFRRKGGMVLLHLGVAGLLMNEIYVSLTNDESQMQIAEGQTVSVASDIRKTEIAIIDQSDENVDRIIVVPENEFQENTQVTDERLPFNLEVLRYIENADLVRNIPGRESGIAADGLFKGFTAIDRTSANGVSADQAVDLSAAYVRLTEKQSLRPLGTFLISQIGYQNDMLDSVQVDGKTYQIGLRFKADYKPYSLKLKDVQAKMYPGTSMAKWYSSDFELNDQAADITSQQRVFMNNPLRYAGETFYQTGYAKAQDGREISTLQIVKNRGWMIPYVCCQIVVVGLIAQFGMSLLGFLEKKQKKMLAARKLRNLPSDTNLSNETPTRRFSFPWKQSGLALVLVAFFALYAAKDIATATFGTTKAEGMRLDLLGEFPITFKGRVQPLDSLARNTVRQLSKREEVYDGNNVKQPAIRWLADTMFAADGANDYRLIRIEDPNVIDTLGLPRQFDERAGELTKRIYAQTDAEKKAALEAELSNLLNRPKMRYTLNELADAPQVIRQAIPSDLDPNDYTQFQSRLAGVSQKIGKVQAIQAAFGTLHQKNPDMDFERRINLALNSTREGLPLAVPSADPEVPWQTFSRGLDQQWMQSLYEKYDTKDLAKLALKIADAEIVPEIRQMILARQAAESVLRNPELLEAAKTSMGISEPSEVIGTMTRDWKTLPKEIRDAFDTRFGPIVDSLVEQQKGALVQSLREQLAKIDSGSVDESQQQWASSFAKLAPAWNATDVDTFNGSLEKLLGETTAESAAGFSAEKRDAELIYNGSGFFYHAMVIFLAAFLVATFGWIGFQSGFNRASSWLLILGWVLLMTGLIFRIYISGRPPVTNLYSSAIFVTAIFVPFMLVFERMTQMGIGNVQGSIGGFLALMWAWTMSITDGDTFTVLMAVLDTQFWLATHVVCITIGYAATFAAGAVAVAYVIGAMLTPAFDSARRKSIYNVMYGIVCVALLFSFFGTVLGGLWGDDSWGRFWGWDPKENGALMIVLWNALSLHARWGGLVKERGFAMIAIFGNVVTLWSWKGVNVLGVGLHAYSGSDDQTVAVILGLGLVHLGMIAVAMLPTNWWWSYRAAR